MAAKKTKTKKKPTKAPLRPAASKKPKKAAARPAAKRVTRKSVAKKPAKAAVKKGKKASPTKKASPPKPVPAKTAAPKKTPIAKTPPAAAPVSSPKAPVVKARDREEGTPVWFTVAGGIEHAVVQRRRSDGAVDILTDAGAKEVVSPGNLFETADQARAARFR